MIEQPAVFVLRTYVASYAQKLRTVRKPVAAYRALSRRKKILMVGIALALALAVALTLLLAGCGRGRSSSIARTLPTPALQSSQI